MYRFYITLLDSFQRYLDSESDDAKQGLLNSINRVPFFSEAADKGSAFNDLIDLLISDKSKLDEVNEIEQEYITHTYIRRDGTTGTYTFPKFIVHEYVKRLTGALIQVYVEVKIETSFGDVILYGYVDDVLPGKAVDIKTTGRYIFPKYLKAWQHKGYSHCLSHNGVELIEFEYIVTDFNNIFIETYPVRDYSQELKNICEQLIEFIQANQDKITDQKIYTT